MPSMDVPWAKVTVNVDKAMQAEVERLREQNAEYGAGLTAKQAIIERLTAENHARFHEIERLREENARWAEHGGETARLFRIEEAAREHLEHCYDPDRDAFRAALETDD